MSAIDYLTLFKRDLFNKDFLNASFVLGGVGSDIGKIRFKGSTSPYFPKKPFKLKFKKEMKLPNSKGVEHINLNPCFTDKSYIREKLLWDLFQQWGGLGPRAYCYADLTINNSYRGLFVCIDALNGDFLEMNGLSGNLYELDESSKGVADLSIINDETILRKVYEKESGDPNDYTDIKSLLDVINNTSESNFVSVMHETFDMKSVYDWFVLNTISQMGDTYTKNYYLLHDISKSSQSWRIIPWDYDMSMGRDAADGIPYPADHLNDYFSYTYTPLDGPKNVLKDRIIANSILYSEYKEHLKNILQNYFTEENLFPKIDGYVNDISESVENDPQRWNSYNDFTDQVEAIKIFISSRRTFLLNSFLGYGGNQNDVAAVSVSQTDVPYYFVDGQGKLMATIWFKELASVNSVTVKVYPLKEPSNTSSSYIRRKFQITTSPSSANFKADVRWEYVHSLGQYNEVVNVEDERFLRAFTSSGSIMESYVNAYANTVTMYDVTHNDCSGYFFLQVPSSMNSNWSRHDNLFWHRWYDVNCIGTQNGFICGDDGGFLFTNDGGSTWNVRYTGIHLAMTKMLVLNSSEIICVGESALIYKTNNGGTTWFSVNPNVPNKNLRDIASSSPNIFAVGDDGILVISNNNGQTWTTKSVSGAGNLNAVLCLSNDEIITAGSSGKIFKSIDAGISWKNISSVTNRTLNAFFLKDGNEVYAVGKGGTLIVSKNKGETWSSLNMEYENDLLCITSYNGKTYIGGSNGKIYTSSDMNNWNEEFLPGGFDIQKIFFNSDGKGFAVGSSGSICITK